MAWNMSSERPIYLQLVDRIKRQIVSGAYAPGDKFPSVREIAMTAAVNPNTMQKALAALESEGLLIGSRTSGRTVTEDEDLISSVKMQIAEEEYDRFYTSMCEIGLDDDQIADLMKEFKKRKTSKGGVS